MSDLSFLHLVGPYPRVVGMYLLSFLHLTLGRVSWVVQCLIYFSYTLLGHTSAYACFTFLPCIIVSSIMYVCMCLYVCVCVGDCALCMTNSYGYVSDSR